MTNEVQKILLEELYRRADGKSDRYFSASDLADQLDYKTRSVAQSLASLRKRGLVESMVVCSLSTAETYWRITSEAAAGIAERETAFKKYEEMHAEYIKLFAMASEKFGKCKELAEQYGF